MAGMPRSAARRRRLARPRRPKGARRPAWTRRARAGLAPVDQEDRPDQVVGGQDVFAHEAPRPSALRLRRGRCTSPRLGRRRGSGLRPALGPGGIPSRRHDLAPLPDSFDNRSTSMVQVRPKHGDPARGRARLDKRRRRAAIAATGRSARSMVSEQRLKAPASGHLGQAAARRHQARPVRSLRAETRYRAAAWCCSCGSSRCSGSAQGLSQWRGAGRPADGRRAARRHCRRSAIAAVVFFAVIDLVAAVGLWLAAAWGGVVWLVAVAAQLAGHPGPARLLRPRRADRPDRRRPGGRVLVL